MNHNRNSKFRLLEFYEYFVKSGRRFQYMNNMFYYIDVFIDSNKTTEHRLENAKFFIATYYQSLFFRHSPEY